MNVGKLTRGDFLTTVAKGGIVIIGFTAPTCATCRAFEPIFDRIAARFPDLIFGKVDTNEEAELASELTISHIPCLMIYRDEFLLFKQPGTFSEAQMDALISTAVGLDLERLRRHAAGEPT
jgi:thioredoxin 1